MLRLRSPVYQAIPILRAAPPVAVMVVRAGGQRRQIDPKRRGLPAGADFRGVGGALGEVGVYLGKEWGRENNAGEQGQGAVGEAIKEKGRWEEPE